LVGPKNLFGRLAYFWPDMKLVGLKQSFDLLALFWPFYAETGSSEGKYCYSIFFGNTSAKFLW